MTKYQNTSANKISQKVFNIGELGRESLSVV